MGADWDVYQRFLLVVNGKAVDAVQMITSGIGASVNGINKLV